MGKPTGFLDYTRVDCPSRDVAARTGDYAPVELPLSERNRRRQSGRCMDCGVPFCQTGASFEGGTASCNGSRIDTVSLVFAKAQAFSVEVGVQRIDDVGVQAFVKQKSKNVVAVVSGSLKPYLYFVLRASAATNGLQEPVKALRIVLDGEYICQSFAFRAEDKAVVLVLSNINSHTNHDEYLRCVYLMLGPQDALLL